MAYIEKRTTQGGKIRWRVQIRLLGHTPQSATFSRRADAIEWGQRREAAMKAGEYFPHRQQQHTLRDMLARYAADVLPREKAHAQGTKRGHLAWWSAALGETPLPTITPRLLAQARDHLLQGRAPATVTHYLSTLSTVYAVCIREWGWCTTNPVSAVRKPALPRGRVRFLSEAERTRLLTACQHSRNPDLYALVVLALCTGARRGELLGLRWQDVDLTRGRCTFHETKNDERRSVPLAPQARAVLQQRAQARDAAILWVFPGTGGQPLLNPRLTWERACRDAGLTDFRFHDLRHCCASYLAMSGASLLEIAAILGHKTLAMVQRYSHLSEQHTASVVDRMAEKFMHEPSG